MAKEGEPKSTFCAFSLRTPTESAYLFWRCAQLSRRRWLLCRRPSPLCDEWALILNCGTAGNAQKYGMSNTRFCGCLN